MHIRNQDSQAKAAPARQPRSRQPILLLPVSVGVTLQGLRAALGPVLSLGILAMLATALPAQQPASQSPSQSSDQAQSQYQGVSNPPADDTILVDNGRQPAPKPPAGSHVVAPQAGPAPQPAQAPVATVADPALLKRPTGDPVGNPTGRPGQVAELDDPDGDIVHVAPLGPNQLEAGTRITVKLLEQISTADSQKGDPFRSRVAYDVVQNGQVLIPAGSEIDGVVAEASSGHFAGHGSLRLKPETVVLPNGARCFFRAETTATPGSRTRVGSEGQINPGSRAKRDAIEYGGGVGVGATTGALVAGPVGALTGGLIGAGAVTGHLLLAHPQATLEPGTAIEFTTTERLNLAPQAGGGGN